MRLLTDELRAQLPALYGQQNKSDPTVYAKFFTPDSGWTWYVTEGQEREDGDFICFGYVIGLEKEWGHFSLSDLQSVRGKLGLPVERDLYFEPGSWSEVKKRAGIETNEIRGEDTCSAVQFETREGRR
jgi:hypothetical protein